MKKQRWLAVPVALFLSLFIVSAAAADTEYVVQWGDTLSRIAGQFQVTVDSIVNRNSLANPNVIYAGQRLMIPTEGELPPPAPPPDDGGGGGTGTYVVQPGDTLFGIALRYNTTVQAIAQANGISNVNYISVGQILNIPGAAGGGGGGEGEQPPAPPPPPPASSTGFELGGQTHTLANPDLMKQAGMSWVKFQHKWSPGDDPGGLAGRVQQGHSQGFKVLLSITGANLYPAPGSIDFNAFTEFLRGVASQGANSPDAIEVWNESNIDREWPAGQIDPAAYVNNMLRPAYNAIKGANPNILVISGAPAPTGFDNGTNAWADNRYLAGMAAAGAASYMDCVGAHHNAGATSPYATSGHPAGTHYSWYYGPTVDVYYNAFGGARKVCLTELGYLSGDGYPPLPSTFAWASETYVAEHAQWLAEATSIAANSGKVRMLIVFNVDFDFYDSNSDPQAGYAIRRPDGSCPACATMGAVMNP